MNDLLVTTLATALGYAVGASVLAGLITPFITHLLYRYEVIKGTKLELIAVGTHRSKSRTPTMGGLIIILAILIITLVFNWDRSYTWVPIGVMALSALLGGIDDVLNVYGEKRRNRSFRHIATLIRVHRNLGMRIWYIFLLPWTAYTRTVRRFGSYTGRGVHVHEKLVLQLLAGSIAAWWIYSKLGPAWHSITIPFSGEYYVGWLIIPFVILVIMFTANAVNIADGMDGLAGGMLIPTFGALTLISSVAGFESLAYLNATVMGATIVYTYFNIRPARFHMGDIGSLGLGALLAVNALAINQHISLLFIGFMFYIEATSVLIQLCGKVFGKKIFLMAPLHHHFELRGWPEDKVIMRFWMIHLLFVIIGTWLALQ